MGDAIGKAVETLKDAQEAFMLLPIETSLLELVQQQACLQKLMAIIADWCAGERGRPLLGGAGRLWGAVAGAACCLESPPLLFVPCG